MKSASWLNQILYFMLNNFDFIIRFVYCKMQFYKLAKIFFPHVYNSNFESLSSYFQIINEILQKHDFLTTGKSIMELGPGTSLIIAYNFLLRGAKCAILVDKYPRLNSTRQYQSYKKNEFNYFKCHNETDVFDFIDYGTGEPRPESSQFIAGDLCKIKLDEKVDLKDKYHFFGTPFLFYKYSDFVWNNLLTDEAVTYTNRVRYQEYVNLFNESGFEIVWQNTISHDIPNCKIDKKFS
jgi:hypothetical protein